MVQLDLVPEGIKEKLGTPWARRTGSVQGELRRFKEMIEARGAETGAGAGGEAS